MDLSYRCSQRPALLVSRPNLIAIWLFLHKLGAPFCGRPDNQRLTIQGLYQGLCPLETPM